MSAGPASGEAESGIAQSGVTAAEFASAFRDAVAALGGIDAVRDGLDTPAQARAAHRDMMDGLGLGALLVPEEFGGLGESLATAVAIGRQAGRVPAADLAGPYVMAPTLLHTVVEGTGAQDQAAEAARTLAAIAAGDTSTTVAVDGLVFDVAYADTVIVYVGDELRLVNTADVELEELSAFDPTRTVHRIVVGDGAGADTATTAATGTLLAKGATAQAAWNVALCSGRIYLAAELEGTARAMLEATVSYLAQRVEFGRPLGSFQALKHQLAGMWSEVSLVGPLVDKAVQEFVSGRGDAQAADGDHGLAGHKDVPNEAELYAAAALSLAADTATAVCEHGLQLHGGIGYTWESSVHLWLKRAAANRVRLDTPHALRARLAELADI